PELAAQSMEMQRFGHVHVSCAATLPIEPAPIVTTTSPLCATRRMACGSAVRCSTNTGSTLPATRTARASERPSAAMIGASPAGYTSASSSASAVEDRKSTRLNSSHVEISYAVFCLKKKKKKKEKKRS